MQFKHSEGPFAAICPPSHTMTTRMIVSEDGQILAHVGLPGYARDSKQEVIDADLLAAAPRLLRSLAYTMDAMRKARVDKLYLHDGGPVGDSGLGEAIAEANAVLAHLEKRGVLDMRATPELTADVAQRPPVRKMRICSEQDSPAGWAASLMDEGYKVTYTPSGTEGTVWIIKHHKGAEHGWVDLGTDRTLATNKRFEFLTLGQHEILDELVKLGLMQELQVPEAASKAKKSSLAMG